MSDPKTGCGISKIWFRAQDKFGVACNFHDEVYTARDEGRPYAITRSEADGRFLKIMLEEAKLKGFSTIPAYFYYFLVRALGWIWW